MQLTIDSDEPVDRVLEAVGGLLGVRLAVVPDDAAQDGVAQDRASRDGAAQDDAAQDHVVRPAHVPGPLDAPGEGDRVTKTRH